MAILTLHHWGDLAAGLAEMVRVARRRVVIVTFDLWDEWYGHLRKAPAWDVGLRLVRAELPE